MRELHGGGAPGYGAVADRSRQHAAVGGAKALGMGGERWPSFSAAVAILLCAEKAIEANGTIIF